MMLFTVHFSLMSLAFATFVVSFLMAVFFLLQESRIKNHRFTSFSQKLIPLETLDRLYFRVLSIGFLLLSSGMIVGAVLSRQNHGVFFRHDPRTLGAYATWALYAVILNIRFAAGLRGRKGIVLSLLGFLGVALTFLTLGHGGH